MKKNVFDNQTPTEDGPNSHPKGLIYQIRTIDLEMFEKSNHYIIKGLK